jgi:hypothetical protein
VSPVRVVVGRMSFARARRRLASLLPIRSRSRRDSAVFAQPSSAGEVTGPSGWPGQLASVSFSVSTPLLRISARFSGGSPAAESAGADSIAGTDPATGAVGAASARVGAVTDAAAADSARGGPVTDAAAADSAHVGPVTDAAGTDSAGMDLLTGSAGTP